MKATTKPIFVTTQVDVQPTPTSERRDPWASPPARSPLPRSPLHEAANPLDAYVRSHKRDESGSSWSDSDKPLGKKTRWLLKVVAWVRDALGRGKAPKAP